MQAEKGGMAPPPPVSAMCYAPARPPARAEYYCPECGAQTVYKKRDTELLSDELPFCRNLIAKINQMTGASMQLDESSFCKKCSPKARKPELRLTINHGDGASHTIPAVGSSDLFLILSFLKCKSAPESLSLEENANLQKNLSRVHELLAIKP